MTTSAPEDDAEPVSISTTPTSFWVSAHRVGPEDDGPAGVREPLHPHDAPPSLAAEAEPDRP